MSEFLSKLLRAFFHLLYNQFAFTYDLVAWLVSFGSWQEWVGSVSDKINPGRILEVGHGPGHLLVSLLKKGKDVYGIDLSPSMARLAKKKILKANRRLGIAVADGVSTPFPDDAFDQIVATFPAEYFFSSTTLTELRRILKPGGSIITLPLVMITGSQPWHRILAWIYKMTGQSTKSPNALIEAARSRFSLQGFNLRIQIVDRSFYQLLILQAHKLN